MNTLRVGAANPLAQRSGRLVGARGRRFNARRLAARHDAKQLKILSKHLVHVIDHGRLVTTGSPYELTRGTGQSTIRLVVTEPFPPEAPASLQRTLGPDADVRAVSAQSLLITGPADATTLAKVSAWCEEHGVLPESLSLGQRTLEDVFLQLTGRELVP